MVQTTCKRAAKFLSMDKPSPKWLSTSVPLLGKDKPVEQMTVKELRAQLRSRGAKLSGRKNELVERLNAYIRNSNFGENERSLAVEYHMSVPSHEKYRDINGSSPLYTLTDVSINSYLSNLSSSISKEAKSLYHEKYLKLVRYFMDGNLMFIKAMTRSTHTKGACYTLDIAVDSNSVIQECQCECPSGMGPTAHCKHICAVLFGLLQFPQRKQIITEETCTQKLMTFHHARRFTGSPIKAPNLNLQQKAPNFDPRPEEFRNTGNRSFEIAAMNFPKIQETPLNQLFPPANLYAVANDHDYFPQHPEETFLLENKLRNVSEDDVALIEQKTSQQSLSKEWFHERQLRLTASSFGTVCKMTDRRDQQKLLFELLNGRELHTKGVEHGRKYEDEAVQKFEQVFEQQTEKCGLFISKEHPYLGASPDRLIVNDDGEAFAVLEVKCPEKAKNSIITPSTVPFLELVNNLLQLRKNNDYYYQVQGQLFCTRLTKCLFVVYTFVDIVQIEIHKDEEFITDMLYKLVNFHENVFQRAVLDKFFYKNYGKLF